MIVPVDVSFSETRLPALTVAEAELFEHVVPSPETVHVTDVSAPSARTVTVTVFPRPGAALVLTARSLAVRLAFGDSISMSDSTAVAWPMPVAAANIVLPL